jgi:Ca2+:H+ antiporter
VAAVGTLAAVWGQSPSTVLLAISLAMLIAAVMAAVHHAEVIAHRLGEPFGTLVLALAITVIEVSLIVSLMLSSIVDASALARDTVFATVMIICNGVVGLCLLVGSLRHRVVDFRVEGTIPALAVLATLTTLTLVLPNFTISTSGPTLSRSQLAFAGVVSLVLYAVFVLVQTVRHRDYFLPAHSATADAHAERPSTALAWTSLGLLMVALVAVVGLAKTLAPAIETVVHSAGLPQTVVGICIALMVLMPETISAVRAAGRDRMQTSFNLALGSAMATIGLTIPVVAASSILLGLPLALGLPNTEIVFLALTLLLTFMTLSAGRATVLQGSVHLVVFATYLFLAAVP